MPAVLKPRFWTDEVLVASSDVVEALNPLVAESDIAAQIPAAEIFDRRGRVHRRGRNRHVRGKRHRRQQ